MTSMRCNQNLGTVGKIVCIQNKSRIIPYIQVYIGKKRRKCPQISSSFQRPSLNKGCEGHVAFRTIGHGFGEVYETTATTCHPAEGSDWDPSAESKPQRCLFWGGEVHSHDAVYMMDWLLSKGSLFQFLAKVHSHRAATTARPQQTDGWILIKPTDQTFASHKSGSFSKWVVQPRRKTNQPGPAWTLKFI